MKLIRRAMTVQGRVQGVGFRFHTSHCAAKQKLSGWVRNCADGCVALEVQGTAEQVDRFRQEVRNGPILARVRNIVETELPVIDGEKGFSVKF